MINSKLLDEIFEDDGSYRDLYILDVEIKDWETILELIKNNFEFKFLKDAEEINIDLYDAARIFRERGDFAFLISINYKGVIINTHFFDEAEIEFDIFPMEIDSLEKRMAVFEFMHFIAISINRSISITQENSPEAPYLEVTPEGEITILV
ncbi:hypothetical protein [Pseudoneobacillus sp. C159]